MGRPRQNLIFNGDYFDKMSIFSSIVATIAQDLDQILKERILKLCAEDDQLIILRKQSQDDIAVQGQLKSICDLEAKCQILTSPIHSRL